MPNRVGEDPPASPARLLGPFSRDPSRSANPQSEIGPGPLHGDGGGLYTPVVPNRHILVTVVLILVVLAVLKFGGSMQIPVIKQLDEYTLGSQAAA